MGVKLIFKNANFEENALAENIDDITTNVEWSAGNWQYINASNQNHAYQYRSNAPNLKIGRIDVSQYVGRQIKLLVSCPTGYNSSTKASNIAFASAAADLPASTTGSTIQNAITSVKDVIIPESEAYSGEKRFTLVVPLNAVYLVFKNNFNVCPSPSVGVIEEE